ncbi:MAG: NAD(P)H-hydrate dehydratase [Christensenella sp.]|uniref:NAD(P)H-hydrate dehydratase n=1 Tax=Christensenella sp. TaxID=1935934 RepID=UPI002B2018EC|nr:NAD(P)H-hydrate dehydratase [Christensenella sp.]MEA5002777.1 NAD(P)H-hydrate dehydratase [Christensenella sp.]
MHIALTPAQMRAVDKYMIEQKKIPGILLMENAAYGVFDRIREETEPCSVQVFCGTGNNGGDGLAVARILLANGYDVSVVMAGKEEELSGDAQTNYAFFATQDEGVLWLRDATELASLDEVEVYVDALFGTGLSRNVNGLHADLIDYLNERDALVVSVDIPSGVNAQTGAVMGTAVRADVTVTFQYPKIGHFMFPGREYAGELCVVQIGVDDGCDVPLQANVCAYESDDEDMCLGMRALDTNKGSYGRLLMIAGSAGMAGAAVLCARSASRAGAGLVVAASTEPVVNVLQNNVPEAVCHTFAGGLNGELSGLAAAEVAGLIEGKTALAIGPGLGRERAAMELVAEVVCNHDMIKVVDADALFALSEDSGILDDKSGDVILTPHPKEFAALSGMSVAQVKENPLKCAVRFAMEHDVIVVLKGTTTVVADPFGNASLVCAGSPGMAKGGSGDVLTGVIASFAAQGKDAYEAALMGVYVAGMAGEYAAEELGEYSMTPMDTVNHIGTAIEAMTVDYVEADTVHRKEEIREPEQDVREIEEPEETEEPEDEQEMEDLFAGEPKRIYEKPQEEDIPAFLEKYMDEPTTKHEKITEEQIELAREEEEIEEERELLADETEETELAEVQDEEIEVTQEMQREILEELKNTGDRPPSRRKIG